MLYLYDENDRVYFYGKDKNYLGVIHYSRLEKDLANTTFFYKDSDYGYICCASFRSSEVQWVSKSWTKR